MEDLSAKSELCSRLCNKWAFIKSGHTRAHVNVFDQSAFQVTLAVSPQVVSIKAPDDKVWIRELLSEAIEFRFAQMIVRKYVN